MTGLPLFGAVADYTFAGEGIDYLRHRAGMSGDGRFRVDNYEYTKPVLFRHVRELCRPGEGRQVDDFEILYQGRAYDWSRVQPFGGIRQFLYHADQAIDYGTAQQIDRDAGAAWGEKTVPLFRAWEQAHPELARALAEKRRTAEAEAQIRKANRRAARAEEAARMAQNQAAAAAAAADDAARRAEEAERNARNAEWRARNAELGLP